MKLEVIVIFLLITMSMFIGCIGQTAVDRELVMGMSNFTAVINPITQLQETASTDPTLWMVHPNENWRVTSITVPGNSTVIHKGLVADMDRNGKNEIYAFGGQFASLWRYDFVDGEWEGREIWSANEVAVITRLRDAEVADVDDDNEIEIVVGTHPNGIMYVIDYVEGQYVFTKIYEKQTTFIHEVEVGDIDNDKKMEIFFSPTNMNAASNLPQPGWIMMAKWTGFEYAITVIDDIGYTHAKEIAIGDADNDGRKDLIASLFGITVNVVKDFPGGEKVPVKTPLYIKKYTFTDSDTIIGQMDIGSEIIAVIQGEYKARSVVVDDINNDGKNEVLLGTDTSGLQYVYKEGGYWKVGMIDNTLIGNVHAVYVADVDRDGKKEVLANSDLMHIVRMYKWSWNEWKIKDVFETPPSFWVWNFDYADADNR